MGAIAPPWLSEWTYAHRGLHGPDGALENSLPAFCAAMAAGYGIECDVQQSRDGRAMVFHDWTLDRLTDAQGPVRERGAADLQRIELSPENLLHIFDWMSQRQVPPLFTLPASRCDFRKE